MGAERPRYFPGMQARREGRGQPPVSGSFVRAYAKSICHVSAGSQTHISFPKKKTLLVQAQRKGTSARPEGNGHPSGFFYSPQTDYTHQIRRKAGKFHWLPGSPLPRSASSTPHRPPHRRCLMSSEWGAALVQICLWVSSLLHPHASPW